MEAKIAPQEIDQLYVGQKATLRFTTFNQRSTPEIKGKVSLISADLTQVQTNRDQLFPIRTMLSPEEIARLGSVKLVPGMPTDAFVHTGMRTALSYLISRCATKRREPSNKNRPVA